LNSIGMQPDLYASDWFHTWFAALLPVHQTLLLWDTVLLRPPQFPLFLGVCLMHSFRRSLLAMDEASHVSNFLASCAQLADVGVLVQAALALFQAVPASVTLPVYPRHSAGEALLSRPGSAAVAAVDLEWHEDQLSGGPGEADPNLDPILAAAREHLSQRAVEQWRQCEWWRRRAASALTAPVITVDDLLSFRSRCFVLDVRSHEEFAAGHFQGSNHIRDPEDGELSCIVPLEVLNLGGTPVSPTDPQGGEGDEGSEAASPWLFAFDPSDDVPPELRVRLVVIVGAGARCDFGASFAERLICIGVRHVVCLLGGAGALRADAPRYLVTGPE